jgi:hypothetical protein
LRLQAQFFRKIYFWIKKTSETLVSIWCFFISTEIEYEFNVILKA